MTKARQRQRAQRRKEFSRIPMSFVHGYVDGVEKSIKYWDGKRIQFVEPPPEGAVITILVDAKIMEGKKCQ